MNSEKLSKFNILIAFIISLIASSLYEMLWGKVCVSGICDVSLKDDFPLSLVLAITITTLYVIKRSTTLSTIKPSLTLGFWLLIIALLIAIPLKKYIFENPDSDLQKVFFTFPVFVGIGHIIISKALAKGSSSWNHNAQNIFKTSGVLLLIGGIIFLFQKNLVFSAVEFFFEIVLLILQTWLLIKITNYLSQKEI